MIDGIGMICSLLMPFVMSEIVEKGISEQNIHLVWQYAIIMVFLAIVSVSSNVVSAKLNTAVSAGYSSDLCRITFEKINSLSYTNYTKIGPSGLLTRATDDIWNVEGTITSLPYTLFTVPVIFIGSAFLSFLASQFAIAERRSFSTFAAASLLENLRIPNARNTSLPRTISATRRILRGEEGTLINLANACDLRASFITSADCLFLTPIVFNFFFYQKLFIIGLSYFFLFPA